jgi:hypothetical protein
MKKSKKIVVLLCVCAIAGIASANLLSNAGFEQGDSGWIDWGLPGWNVWGSSGYHEGSGPNGGDKCVKLWWDDTGLWQDFTAVAGNEYAFSIQVYNLSSNPSTWNGLLRAEFYDASNAKISDAQLDRFYSATDSKNQWVEIGGTLTAPVGTAYGRIVFQVADWSEGVGGDLYFDNASVEIPEPATLVILGLGGLLFRRKN